MRRMLRRVGIGLVAFLLVAQLVPVDHTNPPAEPRGDVGAPAPVTGALRAACYDCHSNETRWPWYSHVAPISWLLAYDVSEGRKELNFSVWNHYDAARRRKMMKETVETMNEGEMPPWYYVALHPEARLAEADHRAVIDWATRGVDGATAP